MPPLLYSGRMLSGSQLERTCSEKSWPNVARTEGIRPRESYALAHSGPGGFPKLRRGRQNKAPARSDADRG